jgi:hypothetical protein
MAFFNRSGFFARRSSSVLLTPPSMPVFLISLVLAVAALLVHYAEVPIPLLARARVFDALAIAYLMLFIGVVARRL